MRSRCSHCTAIATARELGVDGLQELIDQFYVKPDNLAIRYGMRFEEALERELKESLGDLVQAPAQQTLEDTIELMNQGVPVIYQGVLRGGSGALMFSGRPDFLLRSDYRFEFSDSGLTARQVDGWSGGYTAWDAKLSSTPKPEYKVQVGLYADVLAELGLGHPKHHGLILGSRELADFSADVLISQMITERNHFINQVLDLVDSAPQRVEDIGSLACDASSYCDICEYPELCDHYRRQTNHLQLVAGITRNQIDSLNRSGIKTVRDLAGFSSHTDKLSEEQVAKLSRQARLQQANYDSGENLCEVIQPELIQGMPTESDGDIFFDIEGFTFGQPGGIEYLFGYTTVNQGEEFHWLWADTRAEEKQLFEAFMLDIQARLKRHPSAHIYHYANYEKAALKRLAKRHRIFEAEVEDLLRAGVFVDLYDIVRKALVLSQESYSIKKLENYYSFDRVSDVKEAMGSMEYYDAYLNALDEDPIEAEKLKRQVLAYNQDDCASTLALVKWLRSLVDRDV